MKKYFLLSLTIMCICLIWIGCSNGVSSDENINTSWVFVANEGNLDENNGSISMIDDFGNVITTEYIGDVVQSLEVYKDKLIVIVNNDHKIILYDITKDEGIRLPGTSVLTENSSSREMVIINDKIYFTSKNLFDLFGGSQVFFITSVGARCCQRASHCFN